MFRTNNGAPGATRSETARETARDAKRPARQAVLELWLILHGETPWASEGRALGQSDPPLSEYGVQQAEHLAERLRDVGFDAVYASDLTRARYTALEIKPKPKGLVEVLTRREGSSGITFALREIDCDRRMFRYLGEGDTRAKAAEGRARNRPDNNMGRLTEGSISTEVSDFACAVRR